MNKLEVNTTRWLTPREFKDEVWRSVPNYVGFYEVSNLGRVKSVKRMVGNKHIRESILSQRLNKQGYLTVGLTKNNEQKYPAVHRLVALSFLPNPDKLPQVNHKDENHVNNRLDNLEWCGCSYNANYGTRNKRLSEKLKGQPCRCKPVAQYDLNGDYIRTWPSMIQVERELGKCMWASIAAACKGRHHTSIGSQWRIIETGSEVERNIGAWKRNRSQNVRNK